jgi:hypothetical protein
VSGFYNSVITKAKGLWNIIKHFIVDCGMNKVMGKRWMIMKREMAKKRAEKNIDV